MQGEGVLSEHISANGITLQCGGGAGRQQRKFSELLYITKYISINVSSTIIQGPKIGLYVLGFFFYLLWALILFEYIK